MMEHLADSKKEVNAACPGETSGSFLSVSQPDYGCNSPHPVQPGLDIPPFKTLVGLKAPYTGAQMDYAEMELASNKHIDRVTLSIGANDFLLVLPQLQACGTSQACANNVLGPVIQTYAANLAAILVRIRALYHGPLVVSNYYSPAPPLDGLAITVNAVISQVVGMLPVQPGDTPIRIADTFTAFKIASADFGGDACAAGLLIRLRDGFGLPPCDIHPSAAGRVILAAVVDKALQ
jgi:hypothetical protein